MLKKKENKKRLFLYTTMRKDLFGNGANRWRRRRISNIEKPEEEEGQERVFLL